MQKHRFTMIDLLVIIIILTLLVALVLPMLNKDRDRAVRSKCISNLKNQSTSIAMYFTDGTETHFPATFTANSNIQSGGVGAEFDFDPVLLNCPAKHATPVVTILGSENSYQVGNTIRHTQSYSITNNSDSVIIDDSSVHTINGKAIRVMGDGSTTSGPVNE